MFALVVQSLNTRL